MTVRRCCERFGEQGQHHDAAPPDGALFTTAVIVEPCCDQNGPVVGARHRANHVGQRLAGNGLYLDLALSASSFFEHRSQSRDALIGRWWRVLHTFVHYRFVDAQKSDVIGEAGADQNQYRGNAGPPEHKHPSRRPEVSTTAHPKRLLVAENHCQQFDTRKTKGPSRTGPLRSEASHLGLVSGRANIAMLADACGGGIAIGPRAISYTVQYRSSSHARNRNHAVHAATLVAGSRQLVAKAARRNTGG